MTTILNIQSSINGSASVSNQLSQAIINQIVEAHPGANVITKDLNIAPIPHISGAHMAAVRTPAQDRSAGQATVAAYADDLINEVLEADIIVIGVPFYNFNIPSTLKSWLDHLAVPGKTFRYSNGRPEGMVTGKKVYLAIAMGSVYSQGPLQAVDSTEPYLRTFLGLLGIKDVTVFKAEGLGVPALRQQNLAAALQGIEAFTF